MLWLALYLPDLPLEILDRGRQRGGPLAVSQFSEGRERVFRCNPAAAAYGIRVGQSIPAALALAAGLQVAARERERESQALQDLALWAYQFSPRIAFDPLLLLLEIGASLRLFGGRRRLLERIERELPRLGFRARPGLAPTLAAAALLARTRPGCQVERLAELPESLQQIPVRRLTRDRTVRRLIEGIGLASIGDCLALPRPELIRRTGPDFAELLDRLLGHRADVRSLWQPPRHFAQRLELLGEIQHSQALVFPARRLVLALCGYLRGHGGATQRLHWQLRHRERPPTRFEQGLLTASRDPDHLIELFRERIERLLLPEPVIELELRVEDWQAFAEHSGDLFAPRAQVLEDDLLERLQMRLGSEAVGGIEPLPDWRPERAWRHCVPDRHAGRFAQPEAGAFTQRTGRRPSWLLEQPRPLPLEEGRPSYGGPLQLTGRAERIEGGWWDGGDVSRDYFIACSPAGERLWIYLDRRSQRWYLQGLFD